jgi:isopenicillin N synthase-like dioxygenase
MTKIPHMFHSPKLNLNSTQESDSSSKFSVPIIDLQDINTNPSIHVEVVDKIRSASKEWGFFQVINHGIPVSVLDEMIGGIRKFHEQEADERKPFYSRDTSKKVRYFSNGSLFRDPAANWRDSLAFFVSPDPPEPEEIPHVCR